MIAGSSSLTSITIIFRVAALIGVLFVAMGIIATPILSGLPLAPIWHNLLTAVIFLVASASIAIVTGRSPAHWIPLILLFLLTRFLGAAPVLAGMLTFCAALIVGQKLIGRGGNVGVAAQALCGISVLTGVVGWLLPFSIHYFIVYSLTLGAIVFIGRHNLVRTIRSSFDIWKVAIAAAPLYALFAMLMVAVASVALLAPSVQYDDLAYHYLLPEQLSAVGRYKMDAASQIWALAPWAGDVLQGIVAVLSGGVTRGAVNAIWFYLTMLALWQLGKELGLKAGIRWLCVALYASLPMVSALNGSMQADSAIAAAFVSVTALAVRGMRTRRLGLVGPFMFVSAFLLALKTSAAVLVLPLTVLMLITFRTSAFFKLVVSKLPLVLITAGSCYAYAWLVTGNPVFPLFNKIFQSPFAKAENFDDQRWHQGLHWDSIWQITFHTDRYQEAYPGAFGFSMLALSGCIVLACIRSKSRLVVISVLVSLLLTFLAIQYARYLIPIVAVLIPLALAIWQQAKLLALGDALLAAISSLNMIFIPAGVYTLHDDLNWRVLQQINYSAADVANAIQIRDAPEFIFSRYLKLTYGDHYALYLANSGRPFMAVFGGNAVGSGWYDPGMQNASRIAAQDVSGHKWLELFERTGFTHVLTSGQPDLALDKALAEAGAVQEYEVGDMRLWRLCKENCAATGAALLTERDMGANILPVHRGILN